MSYYDGDVSELSEEELDAMEGDGFFYDVDGDDETESYSWSEMSYYRIPEKTGWDAYEPAEEYNPREEIHGRLMDEL